MVPFTSAPNTLFCSTAPRTLDGRAVARLPATCGELVQGSLDGVRCLVSCPISFGSEVEVKLSATPGWCVPPDTPKTVRAIMQGLSALGRSGMGGQLRVTSHIPRGRGYGSSTADIGAALYALGEALGTPLEPVTVARLAVSIEPSDSTMFPGLTLFDHRQGSFFEVLGPAPALAVLVLDPGGEVDTIAFNTCDHERTLRRLMPLHREAFTLLHDGIRYNDREAIGQAATLSARAHQDILFNPLLDQALRLAQDTGALGVCRAHSGTILGLLYDPTHADLPAAQEYIRLRVQDQVTITLYHMVGGGLSE